MHALRNLQQKLGAQILGITDDSLEPWVYPVENLSIHVNNTILGLSEVLGSLFPVIARLVGPDFFAQMAAHFVQQNPPKHPALLFWGHDFSSFISRYEPAQDLAYLSDVARLEWAWHLAYNAQDADAMAPGLLMTIPQDRLEETHLLVHPSVKLIASPYPIAAIWQSNQEEWDGDEGIDLRVGSDTLAVMRQGGDVVFITLSPGCFAFVMALQMGQPLGVAWDAALSVQEDFLLTEELGRLLQQGIFIGVTDS